MEDRNEYEAEKITERVTGEDRWFVAPSGQQRCVGITKLTTGAVIRLRTPAGSGTKVFYGTDIEISEEAAKILRDLLMDYYPTERRTVQMDLGDFVGNLKSEWEEAKKKYGKQPSRKELLARKKWKKK